MAWHRRCAVAQVRSGERGRHAVYLQSADQRTSDSPKTVVSLSSQIPRGLRLCARNRTTPLHMST
eukprot:2643330-Prymnesium_polylepis.1